MATLGFKAKEDNVHDDLDEFDFGSMDFDVEEPPDDRNPALKVLSPVGAGIKDYVTNSSNIESFVKQALPVGYGQVYDKFSETKNDLGQLYNGIQNELRPVKETSKRILRKVLPKIDGKIPKKWQTKLEELSAEEHQYQGRQGDDRENQLANLMSTIFERQEENKAQAQNETTEREKVKQGFEQIRHRSEMSQLDAIRIGVESLTQYQNKINYNVQKKQLELSYRQFWVTAELATEQKRSNAELLAELKATRKNTGLPDFVKQTSHERFKELARNKFLENVREGMFGGASDYIRKFTKNISGQVLGRVRDYSNTISGVGDMADGVSDMAGDVPGLNMRDEMIRMGTALPMEWLANKGARHLNKTLGGNSNIRRGGAAGSYMVNTAGDRLHEALTDPNKTWGGLEFLREMLANAAPSKTPESRMEVDNLNRAHEPKPFNRANSKSLDEIIPGLLARIHRSIEILRTGDEKTGLLTYDFSKNRFTTDKKVGSELRQRIAGSGMERANRYSQKILSKVNRGNTLTPEQLEIARKQLIEKSVMGESIDASKISEAKHWGGGDDGKAIAEAFSKYLRSTDGKLSNNEQSYKRQVSLIQDHRSIVSGLGDPRVLLQQLVNAGQLDELKKSGIIDENNNLDRKVFTKWLSEKEEAAPEPVVPPTVNPTPAERSKLRRNRKVTQPVPPVSPTPAANQLNLNQLRPNPTVPATDLTPVLEQLKRIADAANKPTASNSVEANVANIVDLLRSISEKSSADTEVTNKTLADILAKMQLRVGGPGGAEDPNAPEGEEAYTDLFDHAKAKASAGAKKLMAATRKHARRAKRRGGVWWNKGDDVATKAFYKVKEIAGKKIIDAKGKLSKVYGDVFLPGETQARLRQALLEAGYYRDKVTGKVITSLEDIKNDIIDAEGNVVITLEEFYRSYIGGNIRKKASDVFKSLKERVLNTTSFLKETIPVKLQQLKQFGQRTLNKLKAAMPAFDVYVKTDMTKPVLYASLMKYDGYLSKKTLKVIKHPSDIDGEVIDTKGNIVINEDQIKAGLVDVAGVAIGNELTRLAGRALQYAGIGFQALRAAGRSAVNGIGKGFTSFKDYLKDFTVPLSEIVTNSKRTVTLLEKIHDVLDMRLPGKKVKGDLTGDGIRDGSIEDIRNKRKEAQEKKVAKEREEAAKKGTSSTNGTIGKLLDFFKKKKAGAEGEGGGGGKKGLLGMLGLDGLLGGGDEEGDSPSLQDVADLAPDSPEGKKAAKRKAAQERLKRMRRGARSRAAATARGDAANRIREGSRAARARAREAGARARAGLGNGRLGNAADAAGRAGSRVGRRARVLGRGVGGVVNNPLTRGLGRAALGTARLGGRLGLGAARAVTGPGRLGRFIRGGIYNPSLVRGAGRGLMGAGRLLGTVGGAALPFMGKAGAIGATLYGANEVRKTIFDDTKSTDQKVEEVTDTGVKMAGGLAGAKAGAMAGAAAGSFIPVVGNVIGGVVGGVIGGGLGYWGAGELNEKRKGFGAWWDKAKLSNLSKLRLAQYGVSFEDKEAADKLFTLESTLEPYATIGADGNLTLDEKKIRLNKIASDFGITSKEDINLFNQWYKTRFIPVYRKWLSTVRKISPTGKLADIESIIPAKDKLKVAEESVSNLLPVFDNTLGWNRAYLKLTYNSTGVQKVLEDMRMDLQREANESGAPIAGASLRSSVTSTKDANMLAQKAITDKASYVTKDQDGNMIDPNSMDIGTLTERIKKGEVKVEVAVVLPQNLINSNPNQLDALATIRFKAYGLTSLVADKVRALGALEDYLADNVTLDGDQPKLSIATNEVLNAAGKVFGVPNSSGEHAKRWKGWFNGRFLPVFMIYIGAIRKKTGKKKIKDAMAVYPMTEQTGLARAIIGAQGIGEMGNLTSVWNINFNPWAEAYTLNTDSDSTAGNLEAIRVVADKVKLGEITMKDGKVVDTGKALGPKSMFGKVTDSVKNFFGIDTKPKGEGIKATGDTMIKNPTPIAGMGDPVSFNGGGGGNYTDLPKSTGAGWSANKDLILQAAKMSGVDPKALVTTIAVESSFDPNAAPKGSNLATSAKGFGQHLDGSWQEDLQRDGKKFGIPNGTNQFDARASVLMTASRLKFNAAQLEKNLGRPVTTTDLYLAHLMGLGGATKFLKSPGDAIGSEVGGAAAKQHPNYFFDKSGKPLSVKEVYAGFTQKLSKRPAELGVDQSSMKSSASAPTAPSTPTGAPSGTASAATTATTGNTTTVTGGTAPAPQAKAAPASFANTPAAGTPQLNGPVVMDKGKTAVVGTGPKMVVQSGVEYELVLQREESSDAGTYGTLRFPDGSTLNTLELPWKDNQPKISSIPPGTYKCKTRSTSNHGEAYELQGVPGRSGVLIHAGNSAGSADKGMKADSQGCILLGMDRGTKGGQKIITASKVAMKMFHEKMGNQPFKLTIRQGKVDTAAPAATVNFDPVRTTSTPSDVKVNTPVTPAFTPTASVPNADNAAAPTLPRINSTMTSFNPGSPSKAEMQQRDKSMSDSISPQLDAMTKILRDGTNASISSAETLKKILEALKAKETQASTPEPATTNANKLRPMTNTDVPIPQRRNH